jgi:hypothetical protein
LRGGKQAI